MDPEELVTHVEGIVHEPTQLHDDGLDLTVADVHVVETPGRVDFGGGELEPAGTTPHERVWRDADDDYQWWHLSAGTFLLEYNESVADSLRGRVRVQTREAVRERGAFHPTLDVRSLGRIPLTVPGGGLRIKENARVSTLVPR